MLEALRMLSPPSHFKHPPKVPKSSVFFKHDRLVDRDGGKEGVEAHQGRRGTGRGAARRRDRHRGRESRGGWDAEGGGSTPPLLAYLLPSPTFPSLLTTPCPRSPFSSLREFTLAPWTVHMSAIFHPPPMSANFTPPPPCPRSLFFSLREFTLAPWTRPMSAIFTPSHVRYFSPPTPCPRSLFSSLREFTLAPWTIHMSAIFHPLPMSAIFHPLPCPLISPPASCPLTSPPASCPLFFTPHPPVQGLPSLL